MEEFPKRGLTSSPKVRKGSPSPPASYVSYESSPSPEVRKGSPSPEVRKGSPSPPASYVSYESSPSPEVKKSYSKTKKRHSRHPIKSKKDTKRKKSHLKESYESDISDISVSDISESDDEYNYLQLHEGKFKGRKFDQKRINMPKKKSEIDEFKLKFDDIVRIADDNISTNNCMKLISLTHGSVDFSKLVKRKKRVIYNAVTVAQSGCVNASFEKFSIVYTPILMEYSKEQKTIFTPLDGSIIKQIIEDTENFVDSADAIAIQKKRREFDSTNILSTKYTPRQEDRLFSVSLTILDDIIDKLFSVKGSKDLHTKPRGIIIAEKYKSIDISRNLEKLFGEYYRLAISNLTFYEYLDDTKLVNTFTGQIYDILNIRDLEPIDENDGIKKPLYVIITSDGKCIILSEVIFDRKLDRNEFKFNRKTFEKFFGKDKIVTSTKEIEKEYTKSLTQINCGCKLVYYESMNLMTCPLLQEFIRIKSSKTYTPIEQMSMTLVLLHQKYGCEFSTNTELMIPKLFKSTIMAWCEILFTLVVTMIDTSCNISIRRLIRIEDAEAISQHSQNPKGHTAKFNDIRLVGGRKIKYLNKKRLYL